MMLASALFLALTAFAGVNAQESSPDYVNPLQAKVLLYTFTEGFRHDSIGTAIQSLQEWGHYYNISFDATEDQDKITVENLAQYDALLFVHTTGNIFTAAGQEAFVDYLSKGGNFAGVHAASVAYMDKKWAPWTETLGAGFSYHPKRQTATFVKEMTGHPATNPTPDRWTFDEEVYSFTSDPRKLGAKLLYSVDPTSYKGACQLSLLGPPDQAHVAETNIVKEQGDPHPISWCQEYAAGAVPKSGPGVAGRSFYSALGHNNSTWKDTTFMKHIMGGLTWTLASNTTRVARGLYNGAEPTVHTGATNNATTNAINTWDPVLGSDQVAPPPPPPKSTPSPTGSSEPESSGNARASSSGAIMGVSVPTTAWALAGTALGAALALF
ncbi:hypothetical protein CTheo_5683 [Ceratobasidium theobromae]|uniref:ThuA-like domain-containing protein n=1 Tax=Ceratobasidium theobromae TaxID=1582974 RepID=A0A5N5QHB6_9AGAM|nr:hypothetical protein CTheo_5683 [Ceratobasidium theobromae]